MKRETLKTVVGIIVIAGIVVATYLYGNHQRQAQLDREQTLRQQQTTATASPAAAASSTPAVASASPNNGTAPVASVQPNSIQGGTAGSPTPTTTPLTTPTPTASPVAPAASGTTAPQLAQTGPGSAAAIELTAILVAAVALRRSRRAVVVAVRSGR